MALNIIIDSINDITFFDSVRRLLGGVDDETISNEDILDPAFFDMAEMEIVSLVPCLDSTEMDSTDKTKARLAMIHLLAAKLIPTVQVNAEYEVKTIDITWRKSPVKWLELQSTLLSTVDVLLNGIQCYSDVERQTIFAVAPSKRAVHRR